MISLLKDAKITQVENSASAAQTELVSDILDMSGYDSVMFIADLGDVTATSVLTLSLKDNSANSTSGAAAISGASATFTAAASDADNKLLIVDCYRPAQRYVFASLTRTTADAVVDGIIAIQYNSRTVPQTQGSTVLASTYKQVG